MTSTTIRRIAVVAAGLALVATAGCVRVELPEGEYESATEQVDIADATELDVSIDMAAGKLVVTGGSDDALHAGFDFQSPVVAARGGVRRHGWCGPADGPHAPGTGLQRAS